MRILYIPDTQIKRGVNTDHLEWVANYARDKRFDALVQGGDWFDMTSLSSYDRGKKASHDQYIEDDFDAGNKGLERFESRLVSVARTYDPLRVWTEGNHDGFASGTRIWRHVQEYPNLAKTLTPAKMHWDKYNWKRVPFLKPYTISGVSFVHYCALNANGTVSNGRHGCDAAAQARRMMRSTVSGHRQGIDIKYLYTPSKIITSVVAGSFYSHDESYLTLQGKRYWRGVVVLNDVRPSGEFDVMPVSINYLRRKYG
jgi:hypothetical protein